MPTSIILADDHPLLLNGSKEFLEKLGYNILDTATDGQKAYNKILKHRPDIAILDFEMPTLNGLEVAKDLKRNQIPSKIIILTLHKQEALLNEIGKTIDGYLTKDSALEELEEAINTVKKGKTFLGSILRKSDLKKDKNTYKLTASEIKILKYLNENYTSSQIADELFISIRTVEKHRSNIIKKLGLDSSNYSALIIWLKNNPDFFNT
ncbi:response regulator [Pseudotamlana agarivorans]|uniref:response regulator n=1 Tax=Pseudotamlana agarivorans TaxID=481183 RepID=UPI000831D38E|nr:response regulator transcription factor [Tamlana agarivorans]